MSGYPTLRPQPTSVKIDDDTGTVGAQHAMMHGLYAGRKNAGLQATHPLQISEEQWLDHQFKMDCVMLKNSQGVHAPLKLQMERHIASMNMRLPCLPSSNIMLDTLTGRDELIGFEDVLNNPADSEVMGQPHIMMEKQLGIL